MKKSSDLPVCSAVPQPLRHRVPQVGFLVTSKCNPVSPTGLHHTMRYNFDSLWDGRSGDRISAGGRGGGPRFSVPVQTGPEVQPVSYTMSTGSFQGVKRPRRVVDHPTPSSVEVKETEQLYLYSPSGTSWPVLGRTCALQYSFKNSRQQKHTAVQ
jgi:hypothetical protein